MDMGISGGAKRAIALVAIAVMVALATLTSAPAQAAVAKPAGLAVSGASTSGVAFTWKPVKQAISYSIQVSARPDFGGAVVDKSTVNTVATTTDVLPVGRLYWRVRATTPRGKSGWANSSFTQAKRGGPALLSPDNGARLDQPGQPPVLSWQPVAGAEYYEIEIDGDERDWVDTQTLTTATTSLVVAEPQPNGSYWWRARAVLATGIYSLDSTERTYTIGPLPSVTLHPTPDPMEQVVLSWDPVPGAVSYELRVSTDNGFNVITERRTVSGTRYSPIDTYDNASYWWQVRAMNALGQSEEWPTFPTRTGVFRRAWPARPEPVHPLTGSAPTGDLFFQWTPTRLASSYQLDVGTDPGFSNTRYFQTCTTTQTTYTAGRGRTTTSDACLPQKAGTYYWRVQAIDGPAAINSVFSPVQSFTFTPSAASSGTLGDVQGERLMLDGNGPSPCTDQLSTDSLCENVTSTPVYDWDPVPGAHYYLLYLSHDRLFTNMVSGYGDAGVPNSLPATTSTRWTSVSALPDTQAGEAYYWYVRACNAQDICGLTPDQASNAFQKKSVPTNLVSPIDGVVIGDQITFSWSDYLATNQAAIDPATGEHPGQAARHYRIQVAKDEAFSALVDTRVVDQTTYTAFDRAYPEGTLWWRVQAIDGSLNSLTWSTPRSFTKASPTPTLLAPAPGAVASGVQPFRWAPLDYAKYYDLEVYRNNDTTASSANRALVATNIRQTAFSASKPLQALGTDFVWRVRRSDYSGNKSAWGGWNRFRVSALAPVLVSPGAGKTVRPQRLLFSWRPVLSAESYYWQLRRGSDIATVATRSTNYATVTRLKRGAWSWRVVGLDANGDALRATSWRVFKVG